jgi:hypothetical protein
MVYVHNTKPTDCAALVKCIEQWFTPLQKQPRFPMQSILVEEAKGQRMNPRQVLRKAEFQSFRTIVGSVVQNR